MSAIKRLGRSAIVSTSNVLPNLLRNSDIGVIFMLHRFADPTLDYEAPQNVDALREMLKYLRRQRFDLVSLATLIERAEAGTPLKGAIAFTIDDGYRDHATIGAQLFAEFDCPATTFITTGFVDRKVWFWWDKIEYVFRHTTRRSLAVAIGEDKPPLRFTWNSERERAAAQSTVIEACKRVSETGKNVAILGLANAAEVELPLQAPEIYSPMSWAEARQCEQIGMTFGPHTVTHPILANTSDEQSAFEIEESWRRLSAEVEHPVPVFCYPNGQPTHFGDREVNTVVRVGLRGAVVESVGYAPGKAIRGEHSRFRIRRFRMPGDRDGFADLIQYVKGIERIKESVRGARA
jgi:peptidoglycan/xylan/chitin deacetylase (PgdA/CDA1 family)